MEYTRGIFGVLDRDRLDGPPLVLLDGGVERRFREPYRFDNRSRPDYRGYLFQYTLSGCGMFERSGRGCTVPEGEGFLVCFPEDSSYCLPQGGDVPWEFVYLHFDGPAAEPFATKLREMKPDTFRLGPESRPVRMAVELQERLTAGGQLKKYEGGEFLYRFLCGLLREAECPEGEGEGGLAGEAAAIMQREYRSLLGMETLAERLRVSPAHLSRSFKAVMGIKPSSFLTELRLQSAINDLLDGDESIDSIAWKNGFYNGNYFIKVFKKHMGTSPGRYRKKHRPA